ALNAVERLEGRGARPVVLGCQDAQSGAPEPAWQGFVSALHPFRVEPEVFVTDRAVKFGFKDALDYQIIVNWVIAAHKSQGAFQMDMNRADREEFVVLESATPSEAADKAADEARASGLFHAIAEQSAHPKGLAACKP
ncbi:MAG: hypothetical protein WCC73_14185, partial [Terracidiphilus sp.]